MDQNRPDLDDALISVIIPTYEQAEFIKAAVESVLDQNMRNIEIIVVDDGSTDDTAKVVASIGDLRIKYILQAHSGLPAVARNRGVREANGSWIAFLDSDDVWTPDKLAQQFDALERKPKSEMICSNAIYFNADRELGMAFGREAGYLEFTDLFLGNKVICSSVLMTRASFQKVGGFDEDPTLKAVEDYDLWLKISRQIDILYIPEALVKYRKHPKNISGELAVACEKDLRVFRKWEGSADELVKKERLKKILFNLARAKAYEGSEDWQKAFSDASNADPSDVKMRLLAFAAKVLPRSVFLKMLDAVYRSYRGNKF